MSVYKNKATGDELVVCDGCGISELGTKLSPEEWEKVDFTARMASEGFPDGTALEVLDSCPDCAESKA
jgi:hypothetical protein